MTRLTPTYEKILRWAKVIDRADADALLADLNCGAG